MDRETERQMHDRMTRTGGEKMGCLKGAPVMSRAEDTMPISVGGGEAGCGTDPNYRTGSAQQESSISEPAYRLRRIIDKLSASAHAADVAAYSTRERAHNLTILLDCLPAKLPREAAQALLDLLR